MNSILIKFPLGVYPFTVYVCIGEDMDYFLKKLKGKIDEIGVKNFKDIDLLGDLGQTDFSYNNAIIWCRNFPSTSETLSVLNHEIFHAVHRIMETIGMPLSEPSKEAYAYLTGFISEQIYNKLNIFK